MNVSKYVGHIPVIEQWIKDADLDALVLGLGPTAWLTRYLSRDLIAGLRLFGAHDVFRIMPVDDLVVMDGCHSVLSDEGERHRWIVNARPKRLWINAPVQAEWDEYIQPCMRSVLQHVNFLAWDVRTASPQSDFRIGEERPQTMFVSPVGCTTLAWHEGCRRIGVIGMDMQPGKHHTADNFDYVHRIDTFMCKIAAEAAKKGGAILNLSPITSLKMFASGSAVRIAQPS